MNTLNLSALRIGDTRNYTLLIKNNKAYGATRKGEPALPAILSLPVRFVQNAAKRIPIGIALAGAMMFLHHNATAQTVSLGSDANFAVLAGAGITVAGSVNSSAITGNIGTYPTLSVTGLGNVTLTGVNETADSGVMITAKNDLTTAFNVAAGEPATTSYIAPHDFGGATLMPGVYNDSSSFAITGTLTLNGNGNPNAVFIIQADSTLITASDSAVDLIGGAQADNVFWVVGSSATLGSGTAFEGNILAYANITANTGVTVDGRLLAETAAVTLDGSDTINEPVPSTGTGGGGGTVPDTGRTLLLLGSGLAALFIFGRRFASHLAGPSVSA
jgi:hypothetical protein